MEVQPDCVYYVPYAADPVLQIMYVTFWGASVIGTLVYICIHGKEFVDIPHLASRCDTVSE